MNWRALLAEQGLTLGDVVQATVHRADSGIVSLARVEISFIAVRTKRR